MKRSFDFLTLIRIFSKKIINKINISYDFNKKLINYTIDFNNLKYFWTFMIIINKSLLFNYYQLNDITCIDNLNLIDNNNDSFRNRFTLIYVFTNIKKNSRLTVRITINNNQRVPSLANLFDAANWLEREVYDLFGIIFSNHPDLRRILTDYGFTNHPLLKDFPLTGYLELKYNEDLKCVEYQPVKLMQEYRFFNFESPWNQYINNIDINY